MLVDSFEEVGDFGDGEGIGVVSKTKLAEAVWSGALDGDEA